MREKGLTSKELHQKLRHAQKKDQKYSDGKILGSMCTYPHPAAKAAHAEFLSSNLGDAGLFLGTAQLEQEAIVALSELLHAPRGTTGFIVSGGTEANLLALYSARNFKKVDKPEVIVPKSSHFSFNKICDLLNIRLVEAQLDNSFRVDPISVQQHITPRTITIVGNAGSTELGIVDPIEHLSEIAVKNNLPLHVDAAFGGFVIPFLKELGYSNNEFDFALEGVQSITIDPHKMGMSTIPAGGILFRDKKSLKCICTDTPYLTKNQQYTFVGTRSGASVAATWAVLNSLGRSGYLKIVKKCMENTKSLCKNLKDTNFTLLIEPTMNIVAFRSANSKLTANVLSQKGFFVSYVPRYDCIRVIIMPHLTMKHINDFLTCLREL
jgi:tyrosine decarboxylase / aspartate 1-decarboxylase